MTNNGRYPAELRERAVPMVRVVLEHLKRLVGNSRPGAVSTHLRCDGDAGLPDVLRMSGVDNRANVS